MLLHEENDLASKKKKASKEKANIDETSDEDDD